MSIKKEEIICNDCEAEFFIEHDQRKVLFCPFCSEEVEEEQDEEGSNEYNEEFDDY